MTEFKQQDLRGARFEDVDLTGATLRHVDLTGAVLEGVDLTDVTMHGVDLIRVEVVGDIDELVINGVDVAPLVVAELDRRDPDRVLMRPDDPEGFRAAWDWLEQHWAETVERARALEARDPELVHASVDGEWSFVQTLRHLAFATDSWLTRAVQRDDTPWHPLELPWDQAPPIPGIDPAARDARASLDEVLELRLSRSARVRAFLDGLTDEVLASDTTPLEGEASWPPPVPFAVKRCLRTILNEEYHHRQYAGRDLAVLEEQQGV